jgi:hypothetical protein
MVTRRFPPGTATKSHPALVPGRRKRSTDINGLPQLRRILDQGSPLIEAGLLDPEGLKAAVAELENGLYREDP